MDAKLFLRNIEFFYRELYAGVVNSETPLVRLGAEFDGGYLLPEDFSGIHACFSPGVDQTADFEMELAQRYSMPVYMCDHTVEESPLKHPLLHFQKRGIGYGVNSGGLLQPMSTWVDNSPVPHDAELLIQMDIEGAEYDFFLFENPEFLSRCRYIIVEIHYLHQMIQPIYFENRLIPFLKKIKDHFDIIHIHPNNHTVFAQFAGLNITSCLELTIAKKGITLLNKSSKPGNLDCYPRHKLDSPNMPNKPEVELPSLNIIRSVLNAI